MFEHILTIPIPLQRAEPGSLRGLFLSVNNHGSDDPRSTREHWRKNPPSLHGFSYFGARPALSRAKRAARKKQFLRLDWEALLPTAARNWSPELKGGPCCL